MNKVQGLCPYCKSEDTLIRISEDPKVLVTAGDVEGILPGFEVKYKCKNCGKIFTYNYKIKLESIGLEARNK